MEYDTLALAPPTQTLTKANTSKPLPWVQQFPRSWSSSHKSQSANQTQVPRSSTLHQSFGTKSRVTEWWIPKSLLQPQGYYKGNTSIWVPKLKQAQADLSETRSSISTIQETSKPISKSTLSTANLVTKTTNGVSSSSSQRIALPLYSITKQVALFLQLMQGKVSQVTVAELFTNLSYVQQRHEKHKMNTLLSAALDHLLLLSSRKANDGKIAKLAQTTSSRGDFFVK